MATYCNKHYWSSLCLLHTVTQQNITFLTKCLEIGLIECNAKVAIAKTNGVGFFFLGVGGGVPPEKFTSENSLVNLCGLDSLCDIRRDCCHNFVSEWDFRA